MPKPEQLTLSDKLRRHSRNLHDRKLETQPAQEQSNPTQGGSISMLGGLTMCELSVDDGEQQSEQSEVDRLTELNSRVNRVKLTD